MNWDSIRWDSNNRDSTTRFLRKKRIFQSFDELGIDQLMRRRRKTEDIERKAEENARKTEDIERKVEENARKTEDIERKIEENARKKTSFISNTYTRAEVVEQMVGNGDYVFDKKLD